MKRQETSLVVGGMLIFFGIVLQMGSLNLFAPFDDLIWGWLFVLGGSIFLSIPLRTPDRWWGFIPGFALVSLGIIELDWFAPAFGNQWGGTLFLCGLSLGFWAIYFVRRAWWAIIPGGILVTLGTLAGLGSFVAENYAGAILFAGIGLTFVVVALAPPHDPHRTWAFIPAAGGFVVSALILTATVEMLNVFWPLVLIGSGLIVLYRALLPSTEHKKEARYDDKTLSQPH